MTGRPTKLRNKTVLAISFENELVKWLDKIRTTPLGELSRGEVVRNLLQKVKDEWKD